jgi:hypothetical protein
MIFTSTSADEKVVLVEFSSHELDLYCAISFEKAIRYLHIVCGATSTRFRGKKLHRWVERLMIAHVLSKKATTSM